MENPRLTIHSNITLRDLFAAAALAGILASEDEDHGFLNCQDRATWAYQNADAMLAARPPTPTPDPPAGEQA